ncbi:MAG: hypothetical protein ACYC77_04300 [Coriobacteriia bacterium]
MNDTMPPENQSDRTDPVSVPEPAPTPVSPAGPAKLKTDVPFLILGLATPVVLFVAIVFVGSWLQNAFSGILMTAGPFLVLAVFLVLLNVGSRKGDARLKSYGKGGLLAFLAIPLLGLLAFGSCLIGGFPA